MNETSIKRMKEFIAEEFEDIEEQLKEKTEIYECSAAAFDLVLRTNPVAAQQEIEYNSIVLIKSGYYITSIRNYDGNYKVGISLKLNDLSSFTLNIKEYKGDDLSTPISEIKKGDKIAFIINGNTANVDGVGNFEVSCKDLYVCDSPNDVFVYVTFSFDDEFLYLRKQSLSQLSKSATKTGKLIDRKIYEEYKASRVTNKNSGEESSGCYIATCIYGTYDCPPLWTLRRFRDDTLSSFLIGRLFIKVYYSISPYLVRWFGKKAWFQKFWKTKLDCFVNWLNKKGVKNTLYDDKH